MKKIVCISCVKSKRNRRSKAAELYTSTLFTKALHYAESLKPDRILILSAEYGVLELDEEVDPYEKTLNTMRVTERKQWAQRVLTQLRTKANLQVDEFIFLAGEKYREYLRVKVIFRSGSMSIFIPQIKTGASYVNILEVAYLPLKTTLSSNSGT